MKILGLMILFLCGYNSTIWAWNDDYDTQTIRGKIFDQATQAPLADVLVELQNYYPRKTTRTDSEGRFKLVGVPLGRHKLLLTKDGYDDLMVPGFEVTAGRQSILSLPMHKRRKSKDEDSDNIINKLKRNLVLTNKDYPLDEMSTGTFRVLDVEEINRFAGDQLDPARLAGNYAGIFTQNDWYNGEIIRGNSPYFMQWRLEDLPINNLNQLGRVSTTGGEYNALNPSILSNSDIIMTTTAPHYGNSIAGVFDARLRRGSVQKIEGIVGFNTLQGGLFLLEGPLNHKKKVSSILFALRAKPRNILNSAATQLTSRNQIFAQNASTIYDLALKISFPKTSIGSIDLFAVGGFGGVDHFGSNLERASKDQFVIKNLDERINTTNSTAGLKHQVYIGADKSLYWKTVVGASDFRRRYNAVSVDGDSIIRVRNGHASVLLVSYINKRFSEDISIRGGVNYKYDINRINQNYYTRPNWSQFYEGGAHFIQGFIQGHYTPNRAWSITGGATACYFTFNNFYDFDYRLNIRYKPHNRHQVYLGAGTYTQLLPMMMYTYNHPDPTRNYNNFFGVKSINTNLGYMFILAEDWRIKADGYLQFYRNVPIDSLNPAHSFMNYGGVEEWRPSPNMNSDGRALNFGGEISVEKFFSKGYYFNLAASYVNVAYWSKNSPSTRYRSAFDNTWVVHLFGGKEFRIGKKRQNRFSINAKVAFVEGQRARPILETESANSLYFTIYDDVQGYNLQLPFNLRSDIKFTFLFNTSKQKVKLSHRLDIEVINVSNYNNIYGHYFNHSTGTPAYFYNYPIMPNIGYNLRF